MDWLDKQLNDARICLMTQFDPRNVSATIDKEFIRNYSQDYADVVAERFKLWTGEDIRLYLGCSA